MAFRLDDLLYGLRNSRRFFGKHLDGLTDEQFAWKPYPACKSVRETVVHLLGVDRSVLESLRTGAMPPWEEMLAAVADETADWDRSALLSALAASHADLIAYFETVHTDTPLDATIVMWGDPMVLGRAIPYLSSEDFYHAGQVAFVRLATDPGWNYYAAIYGA